MDSLFISFDFQSDAPIYVQLRNKIIEGIASKQLNPGDPLPSVRNLAKDLGVNMHTINKAYQLLKMTVLFKSTGKEVSSSILMVFPR